MKKIWVRLVAFACAVVFFSCGLVGCDKTEVKTLAGKTPDEVYAEAKKLLEECENYTLSGKIQECVEAEQNGEKYSLNYVIDYTQMMSGNNFYCKVHSDNKQFSSMNMEMWNDGTATYMTGSRNMKIQGSLQEYMDLFDFKGYNSNMLLDLESGFFKDVCFTKVDNGDYEIRSNMDIANYMNMLKSSSLGNMVSSIDEDSITSAVYVITVDKKGNYKGMSLTMVFEMEVDGVKTTITAINSGTFKTECGDMPALPADAQSWTDYTDLYR